MCPARCYAYNILWITEKLETSLEADEIGKTKTT